MSIGDEVVRAARGVGRARRAVRGHVNHDEIVGLGMARNPVELLLDVLGGGLLVGEHVDVVCGKTTDRWILKCSSKGSGVRAGVVELGNLCVGKVADADDERPLLLHGAGLYGRGNRTGVSTPSASIPREAGVARRADSGP